MPLRVINLMNFAVQAMRPILAGAILERKRRAA
jgi:hypothetical protein